MFDEAVLDDDTCSSAATRPGCCGTSPPRARRCAARSTWPASSASIASRGEVPRALLVATDAPPSAALRLITRLSCEATPALAWHGVELPRWAGPSDALLIGAVDGRHPRLAELAAQASRRGMAMAVVAPAGSPVAAAAGRAPVHQLAPDLHRHASRWAVLTPLLQALDALGAAVDPARLARPRRRCARRDRRGVPAVRRAVHQPGQVAGARFRRRPSADRRCRRAGQRRRPLDRGRAADRCGRAAVAVSLPDGAGRAGALLRGAAAAPSEDDFFRDRVEDAAPQRARLLVIGDDGSPDDTTLGERTGAQIQLDEVAARRAAGALRRLAEELGVQVSSVDVPDAAPLARFAAAAAFGEFTAAYLAFALGFDPGAPRPAEMDH